jgi:AraC family transcriptional regulator
MPRIAALDEITEQIGPPVRLRWVNAPYGAIAAVARFRHRGAVLDLSASGAFRMIFHLSASNVETQQAAQSPSRRMPRSGSILASTMLERKRIQVLGAADTLHMFLSPEFMESIGAGKERRLSRAVEPALRAYAVQALIGISSREKDDGLERAVSSVASMLARGDAFRVPASGGLSPRASRVVHDLLDANLRAGISVAEVAEAAGLSLHHFIKMCRATEGCTPHVLLLQKRIERATALLSNPGARIDEVAMIAGFSSPSHFVSTFRRLTGVTPAAYREAVAA